MADQNPYHSVRRQPSLRQRFAPHVARSIASLSRSRSTRSPSHRQPSSSISEACSQVEPRFPTPLFLRPLDAMPKQNNLTINAPNPGLESANRGFLKSPSSPLSPRLPIQGATNGNGQEYAEGYDVHVHSPITSLPPVPSPASSPNKVKSGKSIFANIKAARSTPKLNKFEANAPSASSLAPRLEDPAVYMSSDTGKKALPYRRSMGSTPELNLPAETSQLEGIEQTRNFSVDDAAVHTQSNRSGNSSQTTSPPSTTYNEPERRPEDKRHRFPRLGRKASMKEEEGIRGTDPHTAQSNKSLRPKEGDTMRNAPLDKDRGFRDMMSSTLRNRSSDRQPDQNGSSHAPEETGTLSTNTGSVKGRTTRPPGAHEDRSGFFSAIGSKAADGFGRAGRVLGKIGRSGSSHEKQMDMAQPRVDPNYKVQILTLPLIEQTRRTRISKRLEDCKDKTEFWMPSLPWRCIDFLNANGVNTEGIYRVPGSDRQIKFWEMRFDSELDIDLLKPDTEIYDINVISSLLKAWLRNLPEPILNHDLQDKILKDIRSRLPEGAEYPTEAPIELRDYLSSMSPFHYYLLFALTCHISLLNAHHEITKMPFANLQICLQPALKLSAPFFTWLVEDWRNCWQGCWTEKEYLEKEYEWLEAQAKAKATAQMQPPPEKGGFAPGPGGKWAYSAPPAGPATSSSSIATESRGPSAQGSQPQTPTTRKASVMPTLTSASDVTRKPIGGDNHSQSRPKTSHQDGTSSVKHERSNEAGVHAKVPFGFEKSSAAQAAASTPRRQASLANAAPIAPGDVRPATSHTSGAAPQIPSERTLPTQRLRPGVNRFDSADSDASGTSRATADSLPRQYPESQQSSSQTYGVPSSTQQRARDRAMEKGLSVQVKGQSGGPASPRGISNGYDSPKETIMSATSGPLSPVFPIQHPSPTASSPASTGPVSSSGAATLPSQHRATTTTTTERLAPSTATVADTGLTPGTAVKSGQTAPQMPPQLSPMKPLSPIAGMDYSL